MSTPKLIGKYTHALVYRDRPQTTAAIVTQCGRKFIFMHQLPPQQQVCSIGETVWLVKKTNVPHGEEWSLELYQVTLVENEYMAKHGHHVPQTHFSNCRRIIVEI